MDNSIPTSEDFSYIDCSISKENDKDVNTRLNRKWKDSTTTTKTTYAHSLTSTRRCSDVGKSTRKLFTKCLFTYSMVQSPSWEANWSATSQEFLRISRNPKVHYRTHKRPPTVSILGQPNPVHIPASHLLQIHPNIIHPSKPRSPQWSPSLRFPHQDPIYPLSSPIRATCPAHLILLDFITRTVMGEVYKSFSSLLCNLLHSPLPRPS